MVALVTCWFPQVVSRRPWISTPPTAMACPRSICIHSPARLWLALQAWAELSIERAWPLPIASLAQTEEYLRDDSAGFTMLAESQLAQVTTAARIEMWTAQD